MKTPFSFGWLWKWMFLSCGLALVDVLICDGKGTGLLGMFHFVVNLGFISRGIAQLKHNLRLHDEYRLVPTSGTIWKRRIPLGYQPTVREQESTIKQLP